MQPITMDDLIPALPLLRKVHMEDELKSKDSEGAKKASLGVVPPSLMIAASGPLSQGATKYGSFNWRNHPVSYEKHMEAALRHMFAHLDGEDNAEDSGFSHLHHAVAGLGVIIDACEFGSLIDDRHGRGPSPEMLKALERTDMIAAVADRPLAPEAVLPLDESNFAQVGLRTGEPDYPDPKRKVNGGHPKIVYLAHAISGPRRAGWDVWENHIRSVAKLCQDAADLGFAMIVPQALNPDIAHHEAMRLDYSLVKAADILLVHQSDWHSQGVDMEIKWALELGMPCARSLEELSALC